MRDFDRNDFLNTVAQSTSFADLLRKLGMAASGSGAYRNIKRVIAHYGADVEHFNDPKKYASSGSSTKRDLSEYLRADGPAIGSHKLKLRLIREGVKKHQCEICNGIEWMGGPIPIELDHIDGNHFNNELANLRILCRNCHGQTNTFAGKNVIGRESSRKTRRRRVSQKSYDKDACLCGEPKFIGTKYCSRACTSKASRKVNWDQVDIERELQTKSKSQLARELGCSGTAINKRLKKIGTGSENRTP